MSTIGQWLVDFFTHSPPSVQVVFLVLLLLVALGLVYQNARKKMRLRELRTARDDLANQLRGRDLTVREQETRATEATKRYEAAEQAFQESRESIGRLEQQLEDAARRLAETEELWARDREELSALQRRFDDLGRIDTGVWQRAVGDYATPPFVALHERRTSRECCTRFVAFLNLKGGVGKTTLVANLGSAFATGVIGQVLRVLLVDLDYQGTLSNMCVAREWLLDRRNPVNRNTSHRLLTGAEDVSAEELLAQLMVPLEGTNQQGRVIIADERLDHDDFREQALFVAQQQEVRFRHRRIFHTRHVFESFDLVFFDCPPRLTTSVVNALLASDFIVVPTSLHPNDTDAVPRTLQWLSNLHQLDAFRARLAGVVLNRTYRRGTTENLTRDEGLTLERLRRAVQHYEPTGHAVLENVVPNNQDVARCAAGSFPLGAQPEGHSLYRDVATELYNRIGG